MDKDASMLRRAAQIGMMLAFPLTTVTATAGTPKLPTRAVAAQCGCPVLAKGEGEMQAISLLAVRVCTDATALPRGASVDDLEAAIVYAISQANANPDIVRAALRSLIGCNYGQPNLAKAIARVLASLDNRKLRRGTAALGNGAPFSTGFTAPGVNVGGGSSNYTR